MDHFADDSDDDLPTLEESFQVALGGGGRTLRPQRDKGKGKAVEPSGSGHKEAGRRALGRPRDRGKGKVKAKATSYSWEANYKRSWDAVQEDESGGLAGAVKSFLDAAKRRRTAAEASPVQRGIIRHLVLILDLSEAMTDKDLRPNRYDLTLQYAREFVAEYFDQNPIGQLGILATRDGVAEKVVSMGGNTVEHVQALANKRKWEPRGEPSLQNALEMARSSIAHLPSSNSREILLIFGSLTTCDPGNIHDTISALARDGVRVSVVSIAAELKVLKDLSKHTHGRFGVALNEGHFRDLIFEAVPPPELEASDAMDARAMRKRRRTATQLNNEGVDGGSNAEDEEDDDEFYDGTDLLSMGFPTLLPFITASKATLCSCHSKFRSGPAFLCARCGAKLCDVPTDCPVCGLTAVMSTHLARSYHHLFPVSGYKAIRWADVDADSPPACFSCNVSFPERSKDDADVDGHLQGQAQGSSADGYAASSRYRCPKCNNHFCIECDTFVHDTLHVCPGCC
ncbi:putative SSL1-TFIIH subunit, factor B [Tilletiaria anomala UBC 951]|uniref:General transcription and DNA repair factor IIH n=1 Tax=Tilletiaria anomala (strain ATCC 24038 / CBS 436.72 / UBC 951) TaxID=1037660 RepID=A0A066WCS8_TILAU|nr:putative SSL1-TFIIH subunit, factor B [Tilletiaria anomala UBC 951]KDN48854.1 putative SSL1-TFIIH subunit, factor B [Tilletiaria anomala UBC 951]